MDAVKCEAFLASVDHGSFTAAAETLGYTQSGITRMINSLETELGVSLFIRGKKGVVLTENGKLMLPIIREIVNVSNTALELGSEIKGVSRGSLTIGCYYSISAIWMPDILKAFEEKYPLIKVNMREGGNTDLTKWINEKSVDLCFCGEPSGNAICDWIPLYKDPLVVWLPARHPMSCEKTFPVKKLEDYPFIHTSPDQDTELDRLIAEENLSLNVRFSTRDGFTTYNMVEAGLGISFNQKLLAEKWSGSVSEIPLFPEKYVNLGLAVPSYKYASPTSKKFIEYVKKHIKKTKDMPHK